MIFLPDHMSDHIHSCSYRCMNQACINAQRDELREKYFDLYTRYEAMVNEALTIASYRQRLIEALEGMKGDTAQSFAIFVRDFK